MISGSKYLDWIVKRHGSRGFMMVMVIVMIRRVMIVTMNWNG